ncbi:MAG: bifunctional phosphoglucose/phosphomannose isomerase [Patescibacteria group bacterium]
MKDSIENFASQFGFLPVVENAEKLKPATSSVLCGMGGSHLAASLLKIANPELDIYIHRDYGLPAFAEKRDSMYIASSYSGNTEEVLDFAEKAREKNFNVVAVATGGRLIAWAQEHTLPYIILPDTGIQPRMALGFSAIALAKLVDPSALSALANLAKSLDPLVFESSGRQFAENLRGKVPIIYSSRANLPVAYNWKVKLNETGKIPAFYNVFPELNHNEMNGFDSAGALAQNFYFIFLSDASDHPQIVRRMAVCKEMYEARGLTVAQVELLGENPFTKIFNSLLLADWTAFALAEFYGNDPENVPMIEEFKKKIAG